MRIEPGAILADRYRVEQRLGSGGMGAVWRARDELLERDVAVKLAAASPVCGAGMGQARRRLRREASALAAIAAPRIARVYDLLEQDQDVFLVMEYADGESLAARLRREPRPPVRDALLIAAQCAQALQCAHRLGIVHRDVKPSNIMLTAAGVKIVDFGIAARLDPADGDTTMTMTRSMVGTAAYFAPERAAGRPAGPAADFYALGVVLYQMLAGHLPYRVTETLAMIHAHVAGTPDPLPRDVPRPAARLCLRLLAKNPGERPTSPAGFYAAREALARPASAKAAAPRLRGLPMALSGTAAAAVAATAWALLGHAPMAGAGPASAPSTPAVREAAIVNPPASSTARAHASASPTRVPSAARPAPATTPFGYSVVSHSHKTAPPAPPAPPGPAAPVDTGPKHGHGPDGSDGHH